MILVCSQSYWDEISSSFATLGPPLRPSAEDIIFLEEAVAKWIANHPVDRLRATLLGVTPEIAQMRLPAGSSLLGFDQSLPMARALWPRNNHSCHWAICSDWLSLPMPDSSCDVVIGDGSMNCLRFPGGFRALAASVRNVLRPDGLFLLRCFVRPASNERTADVFSDLLQLRIGTFHQFKFRLLMAMQPSAEDGILLNDVYNEWVNRRVDEAWLRQRTGWEECAIRTIQRYRDQELVHSFPTLTELRALLQEFFDEESVSLPTYTLGDRCPRLALRPRAGDTR